MLESINAANVQVKDELVGKRNKRLARLEKYVRLKVWRDFQGLIRMRGNLFLKDTEVNSQTRR